MRLIKKKLASQQFKALTAIGFIAIFVAAGFGVHLRLSNSSQPDAMASAQEPADINSDNKVDVFDLSILLARWNTADTAADVNSNGTVDVFDLSMLLAKWGPIGPAGSDAPTAMNIISRGKPAFASSGTASYGGDADYDTSWNPSGSGGWLAYDLSSVPIANRRSVVLDWYSSLDDGYSVDGFAGACPAWSGRPYFSNYTVQVNSASGGGSAPTTGWQTVATVSGSSFLTGSHHLNFEGNNWIRINGTGPNGINVNVDVADASAGLNDGWIFFGDSITNTYAHHTSLTGLSGASVKSFTDLISAGTSGAFTPLQQNAAMSCTKSWDALTWIDGFLDKTSAKYVTLNFGANDNWEGSANPQDYYDNMVALANKVHAKGKVPVIPKLTWPNNGGAWDSQTVVLNAKIEEIYQDYPFVVPGPDLYTLTKNKPSYFNDTGDVHPSELGAAVIRQAWAESILTNVYGN